jgi:hypothetical protein
MLLGNRLQEVVRAKRCDGEPGQAGNRDNPKARKMLEQSGREAFIVSMAITLSLQGVGRAKNFAEIHRGTQE